MKVSLLQFDDAFVGQATFLASCEARNVAMFDAIEEGKVIRLWGKDTELNELHQRLRDHVLSNGCFFNLFFLGSGDFHHVSALLIEIVATYSPEPITVIHFDNHPDWVCFKNGMHCGSWVNRALAHNNIEKIITVGVCSNDLNVPELKMANLYPMAQGRLEVFPFEHKPSCVRGKYGIGAGFKQVGNKIHWSTIQDAGEENFLSLLMARIQTKFVYITIDKDVLSDEYAVTNWDQGKIQLAWLLKALRMIGKDHKIIGADVVGDYSIPHYEGGLFRKWLKKAEIFIDQPKRKPDLQKAANLNGSVNQALMQTFAEVMP